MFLPATITSPLVLGSIPPRILSSVDLPTPEEPKITTNSPLLIEKVMLENIG